MNEADTWREKNILEVILNRLDSVASFEEAIDLLEDNGIHYDLNTREISFAFEGIPPFQEILDTEAEWHYFTAGVAIGVVGGIFGGAALTLGLLSIIKRR